MVLEGPLKVFCGTVATVISQVADSFRQSKTGDCTPNRAPATSLCLRVGVLIASYICFSLPGRHRSVFCSGMFCYEEIRVVVG